MNDESAARHLAKLQREARVRESERKIVLKGLMSVRAGREWVFELLSECGIYATPFATDPHATAFNCGQQNVGLRLVAKLIEAAPDDYILMMKEQDHDRHKPTDADSGRDPNADPESEPDPGVEA